MSTEDGEALHDRRASSTSVVSRIRFESSRWWIPALIVALIGAPEVAILGVPIGQVLALVTAPLWLPSLLSDWRRVALGGTLVLLGIGGVVLLVTNPGGLAISIPVAGAVIGLLVTCAMSIGVIVWAMQAHGLVVVAISYAVGTLVNGVLVMGTIDENVWKYTLAYPAALILLALCARSTRVRWEIVSLVAIGVLSAAGAYRSLLGICAVVLIAMGLSALLRRREISIRGWDVRPLAFIASMVAIVTALVVGLTQLLLSGLAGERAQASTELAISRGGDIISGGRSEWVATIELFSQNPWGFGPGAVPTDTIRQLVRDAFQQAGIEPSWQHINTYVIGERFKLHSTYGDLWVNFGPITTLVFFAVCAVIMYSFISRATTKARQPALLWLLLILAGWDLLFSPIYTNFPHVIFAMVVLTFALRSQRRDDDSSMSHGVEHGRPPFFRRSA